MFCQNCGIELDNSAKYCSNCGYKVKYTPKPTIPGSEGGAQKDTTHNLPLQPEREDQSASSTPTTEQPEKKKGCFGSFLTIMLIVIAVSAGVIYYGHYSSTKTAATASPSTVPAATQKPSASISPAPSAKPTPTSTPTPTPTPESDWLKYYADHNIEVKPVPADVLYEYGAGFVGETIATAIEVKSKSSSSLSANTANNETLSYSITAQFTDKEELEKTAEGDTVIVAGKVADMGTTSLLGADKTVVLNDCHIIKKGITNEIIESKRDEEVQYGKMQLEKIAEEKAKALELERQEYIKDCETVSYDDVARNPSQYKGKSIQVTGKVIQVSEGLLNSVTLRVEQDRGDYWYVTYTRADENESRILEDDELTFYGECDGITSYTSILGQTITVPALKAKYYD